jgi:hypothetical protein
MYIISNQIKKFYIGFFLIMCCLNIFGTDAALANNLLPNSSFEITTLPDVPDGWDQYLGPKVVRDWFDLWHLDKDQAFHGKNCMRLAVDSSNQRGKVTIHPHMSRKAIKKLKWPKLKRGKTYTLSLYLKASISDFSVKVRFEKYHHIKVSNQWRRYSFTQPMKMEGRSLMHSLGITPESVGTLWIDAVQLEEGQTATPYAPSTMDASLLKLYEPSSQQNVKSDIEEKAAPLAWFRVATDRSFYTSENEILVIVNIDRSRDFLKGKILNLSFTGADEETDKREPSFDKKIVIIENSVRIAIPADVVPRGNSRWQVALTEKNGKKILSSELSIRKLPPKNNSVKVDHIRRTLLVNNKPFFIFAACFMRAHQQINRWEVLLEDIRNHGYTAVVATFSSRRSNSRADDRDVLKFLDLAQALGIKVVIWINPNAKRNAKNQLVRLKKGFDPDTILSGYQSEIKRMIPLAKDHPALLAWYLFDEPYRFDLIRFGLTRKLVNYARGLDPYHPHYINYGATLSDYKINGGMVPGDLVSKTQYPIPILPITWVAKQTYLEMIVGQKHKPVVLWLQLWGGKGRYPTPAEQTCMAWLAAVYGATGFQSWPMMPSSKILWDHMKNLIAEMKEFAPVLWARETDTDVKCDSNSVHFSGRQLDQDLVIVAVNATNSQTSAKFEIMSDEVRNPLNAVSQIEGRTIKLIGNGFSDNLVPFERKIYVLKNFYGTF